MATLYVAEFVGLPLQRQGGVVELALVPPGVEQTVAIGAGSVASSAFAATTTYVRIHTDAICSIAFGTAPTAVATTMRMVAGQTEYFAVPVGLSFKVAVITNT